jgi:iron complex outermembrane receptor protein
MRNRRGQTILVVFILLLRLTGSAAAGERQIALQGTVRDPSGAVLVQVSVTARDLRTGVTHEVVSDAAGTYRFAGLVPGTYAVQAAHSGFDSQSVTVVLAGGGGGTHVVDLTLGLASLEESVTVTRAGQDLAVVPQAVGLVPGDAIQVGQRKTSLTESLRAIPGLFLQDRGNFSESNGLRLSVRAPVRGVGIGIRGVQMVQDDVPLTMPDGITQPSAIDLGSADRIEVIRGPSAVLYGNAAGGVITIRTEAPSLRPFLLQPDVQFGSDGYDRQQLKVSGTTRGVGYLANVTRTQMDGFRRHSRAEIRQANALLQMPIAEGTDLRAVFAIADVPFAESPSTLAIDDARANPRSVRQLAIDQGLGEASTQGQGGLTLSRRVGNGPLLKVTGWGMWRDVWNPIPFRVIDLGRRAAGLRLEISGATHARVPVAWTAGVDAAYQRDDRSEYENDGVGSGGRARPGGLLIDQLEQVRSIAPFAQITIELDTRWMLTAGVRFDYYRFDAADRRLTDGDQSGGRTLDAASPIVGVTYLAHDDVSLFANVATAYETPTTQELSNRPSGEGGFNRDLEPETLRSIEGGIRGRIAGGRVNYELTAYTSQLENALIAYQRADEQEFFRNAGQSSRDGAEISIEARPHDRLEARLAYAYQRFTFDRFLGDEGDFSGRREPGAPPHQLFAAATYRAPIGLTSTTSARWVDAYAANSANTVFNWSSTVFDWRAVLERPRTRLGLQPFVGINNLFNERYNGSIVPNAVGGRYFEPAPGREFYVGLTLGRID